MPLEIPVVQHTALVFYVNGRKVVEKRPDPEVSVLQYLRLKLKLCGTKLGCAEGGCGACTIMISTYNRTDDRIEHHTANACLTPVCSLHGAAVTTVEGIGSIKSGLHPVQERIAKSHGSQCGFCTPGIVMSMYTLLRNNCQPAMDDIETAFQGNLCRCTGYRPILEGFKTFTQQSCCGGRNGQKCCKEEEGNDVRDNKKTDDPCQTESKSLGQMKEEVKTDDKPDPLFNPKEFLPYDPTQEPIFPPELKLTSIYDSQTLHFKGDRVDWWRPSTLRQLVELKATYPDAKLVVGNSEIGVEVKFKNCLYPVLISPTLISQLHDNRKTENGVVLGAATTLSQMEHFLREVIGQEPEHKTRVYTSIVEMLQKFAGKQIRNVACIAGNIMTASPISDLNPIFLAANCTLTVVSKDGHRAVKMDENFFTGYRKTAVQNHEVVISVEIPFTHKYEYFLSYKQARRRDDDISIVNAGFRVMFRPGSTVIQQLVLAYGGMAPWTALAKKTADGLIGRSWDDAMLDEGCRLLALDLPLDPSAPGSMIQFRRSLTTSFFFKFYLSVLNELQKAEVVSTDNNRIPKEFFSATAKCRKETPKSTQLYQVVSPGQLEEDTVGRNVVHLSGIKQATGEAVYCDDMPKFEDELYLALVLSTKAHAKIVSIDAVEAMGMDGVEAFFCHKDIPKGHNKVGVMKDEEVFASKIVTCQGQVIGAIVAINQAVAQRAARKVKIEYENIEPIILTIEDAIASDSIHHHLSKCISKGDVDAGFRQSDHVLEGQIRIGGQEHFYLETHCAIAVPKREDGEMEIFSSTQNPTEVQMEVAHVCGVPANRIVCKVKRMGGGFGGKETRSTLVALPCAIAASKLGRPVRCMLDRDEDMLVTGTRNPFLGRYKVGFQKTGELVALDVQVYSNGGNSVDLSHAVTERALFSFDNGYRIANIRGRGHVCLTNLPSNTAFRGFGGPQGMMVTENVLHDVATFLGVEPSQVRKRNLYEEGDTTQFNQKLLNCTLGRCWQECMTMSDYDRRAAAVKTFNKENRWKKRGIAIIPTKFGISFTLKFMNQAGALLHVYKDGSVLLTHGGTEMGQGLHTKMIQVASRALGIPISRIHISDTSTDKVPNTSPTAASASSDLNGMAVVNACTELKNRLEPIIANNPQGTWDDWIIAAYMERISLSATGYYRYPEIGYDFATNTGSPFLYFSYGVGCSEVEIDCLTGDHKVLRTDIVMDVGKSLNPAIDIGQIEGGFMQGCGLFTLEELRHSPEGTLYTRGPGMYKIPSFDDIPTELNVALLKESSNPKAVYSSKAIGEPPLFLASSIFFAIKEAIGSARSDDNLEGIFTMDSPATAEKIRTLCSDRFTRQFPPAEPGTYKPWSIVC